MGKITAPLLNATEILRPDDSIGVTLLISAFSIFVSWLGKKGLDNTWGKICKWFNEDNPRGILIIGPGGVGKSTLAHFLSGSGQYSGDSKGDYIESISTETFKLSNDDKVQLIVLPGQAHRRVATWDSELSGVRLGKFRGVILVLAYGNHTIGDISLGNHRLYNANEGTDAFVQKYGKECLKLEIEVLKIVSEAINTCDKPIWLMTLVTKQDLWWEQRDAVQKHYSEGKFADITKNCVGNKSERQFRHESAFVSLTTRNLMMGQNELLKKTVAGYDAPLQEKSFDRLEQVLNGLMKWEAKHGK